MTGPALDLDALQEKAEKATPGPWRVAPGTLTRVDGRRAFVASTFFSVGALDQLYANAAYVAAVSPDVILAVLALVEEQRAENERLREAVKFAACDLVIVHHMFDGGPVLQGILDRLGEALAGSPAAKEATDG